jgi:hypothetical protein
MHSHSNWTTRWGLISFLVHLSVLHLLKSHTSGRIAFQGAGQSMIAAKSKTRSSKLSKYTLKFFANKHKNWIT